MGEVVEGEDSISLHTLRRDQPGRVASHDRVLRIQASDTVIGQVSQLVSSTTPRTFQCPT